MKGVARAGWVLVALLPSAVAAQGRTCDLVEPTDYRQVVNAAGDEVVYFRGPVRLQCEGDISLASDSAVYNRGQLEIELVGAVTYRDSTRQLTSDWANYLGQQELLVARDDVVVTDLLDGSVVTGQEMQYYREAPDRPASRVIMTGGRPTAVLRDGPPPDTLLPPVREPLRVPPPGRAPVAGAEDTVPPLEITADRLESRGDSLFDAMGAVDMRRGDLTGAADSATFRRLEEHVILFGTAHVQDPEFRLDGDRIDAFLLGEDLEEVLSVGNSRLTSRELRIRSRRLRIALEDGEVERVEAWNPAARALARAEAEERAAEEEAARAEERAEEEEEAVQPPEADPAEVAQAADTAALAPGAVDVDTVAVARRLEEPAPPDRRVQEILRQLGPEADTVPGALDRAVAAAEAEGFQLWADSIDALADRGQIREIRSIGRAYGERPVDTLEAGLPEIANRDWVQGDTIIGFFRTDTLPDAPPAERVTDVAMEEAEETESTAADSTEAVLERVDVIGGVDPALSLYRLRDENGPEGASINFMSASRIVLYMMDGEVAEVEAAGPVEGLHLDPAPEGAAPETAPGTAEPQADGEAPPGGETG
ncbi:MAG TPA: hypothetical protein VK966_04420 [Longimicrobiales bacterium]|nr:hypothetical protein [Longimicrobiales bacterium]